MLHCVYHSIDSMRVVEDEEREQLLASGFWFDSPQKAKEAREKYEQELRKQQKHPQSKTRKERSHDE